MEQPQTKEELIQWLIDRLDEVEQTGDWLRDLINAVSPLRPRRRADTVDVASLWARYRDTPNLTVEAMAKETGIRPVMLREAFASRYPGEYRRVSRSRHGVGKRKSGVNYPAFYQDWLDRKRPTLRAMGEAHGISCERVRQILSKHPNYRTDLIAARKARWAR